MTDGDYDEPELDEEIEDDDVTVPFAANAENKELDKQVRWIES